MADAMQELRRSTNGLTDADPAELDLLFQALPPHLNRAVKRLDHQGLLLEVVLDLGREPEARFPDHEVILDDTPVTAEDWSSSPRAWVPSVTTTAPASSGRCIASLPFVTAAARSSVSPAASAGPSPGRSTSSRTWSSAERASSCSGGRASARRPCCASAPGCSPTR